MWCGHQRKLACYYQDPNITRAVAGWQPWAAVTIMLGIITTFCFGFQAEELKVHPWYIMLPAAISCSFAFMLPVATPPNANMKANEQEMAAVLPVATPPNAIVFSGGHLKVKDMVGISTTFIEKPGFCIACEIHLAKELMRNIYEIHIVRRL